MDSSRHSIQSLQDLCDRIPNGDVSPTKGGYSLYVGQRDLLNTSHQIEQQNSEYVTIDILKPDAVKAIIREEIVNKGYDIIDFSQFLAVFQRGNVEIPFLLYFPTIFLILLEKGPSDGRWTMLKLYEVSFKKCVQLNIFSRLSSSLEKAIHLQHYLMIQSFSLQELLIKEELHSYARQVLLLLKIQNPESKQL